MALLSRWVRLRFSQLVMPVPECDDWLISAWFFFSSANSVPGNGGATQVDADIETIQEVVPPKLYKVILLNDDYTPMNFVVLVLRRFFGKTEEEANRVMMEIHKKGAAVGGVYTLEVAEMRVVQCNQFARSYQYPLKTTLEPE